MLHPPSETAPPVYEDGAEDYCVECFRPLPEGEVEPGTPPYEGFCDEACREAWQARKGSH
jgi:hypothetical protein